MMRARAATTQWGHAPTSGRCPHPLAGDGADEKEWRK
jgi:hypothetical protein